MNAEIRDQGSEIRSSGNYEETLRLIARLSAPEGLEERVQAGLRAVSPKARILRWPDALRLENVWMQNLLRASAAAAIAALVIGGCWSISTRYQPAQPTSAVAAPLRGNAQGGFSSAGAMRTTLNGPIVTHPAISAPETDKPDVKTTAKKPVHHGKSAMTNNPVAPNLR